MNRTEFPQASQLSARHIEEVVKHALQMRSLIQGASKIKQENAKLKKNWINTTSMTINGSCPCLKC